MEDKQKLLWLENALVFFQSNENTAMAYVVEKNIERLKIWMQ